MSQRALTVSFIMLNVFLITDLQHNCGCTCGFGSQPFVILAEGMEIDTIMNSEICLRFYLTLGKIYIKCTVSFKLYMAKHCGDTLPTKGKYC